MTTNTDSTDQIKQILSQVAQSLGTIQLVNAERFQNTSVTESLQELKSQILDIHGSIDTASSILAISSIQDIIRILKGITRDSLKRKAALIVRKSKKAETACNLAASSLLTATQRMNDLLGAAEAQSSDLTSHAVELEAHAADLHMHSRNCHTAAMALSFTGIGLLLLIPAKVCHDSATAKDDLSQNCSLANQVLEKEFIPVMNRASSAYSCAADRLQTLGDILTDCALQAEEAEEARLEIDKRFDALRTQDLTQLSFDDANEESAHDQCIVAEDAFQEAWSEIREIACKFEAQLVKLRNDLRTFTLKK